MVEKKEQQLVVYVKITEDVDFHIINKFNNSKYQRWYLELLFLKRKKIDKKLEQKNML